MDWMGQQIDINSELLLVRNAEDIVLQMVENLQIPFMIFIQI